MEGILNMNMVISMEDNKHNKSYGRHFEQN